MNTPRFPLLLVLTLLGAAAPAASAQSRYVRAAVFHVHPQAEEISDEIGYGASLGILHEGVHDFSFDVARVTFDEPVFFGSITGRIEQKHTPLLVSYRRHFPLVPTGELTLGVGATIGFTYIEAEGQLNQGLQTFRASDSAFQLTYGVDAQLVYTIARRIDVFGGWRFLMSNGWTARDAGVAVTFDDGEAHSFYAGLGVRF